MKRTTRLCSAMSAAALFAGSALPAFSPGLLRPVPRMDAAAFAARAAAAAPAGPAECFAELRFRPQDGTLLHDGQAAGTSFGGFQVSGGKLFAETGGGLLPLEEAAERLGCETYTDDTTGEIVVTSPFQNGRVIVGAAGKVDPLGGKILASGYRDLTVLQFDSPEEAFAACKHYRESDSIRLAEPDRIVQAERWEDGSYNSTEDWGVDALGAKQFLAENSKALAKAGDIKVAVIDTGIYAEHSMFAGRIAEGGASFVADEPDTTDRKGHGTHCSGIISMVTPDNVKILPVKALNGDGSGTTLGVYCAMAYALEQEADVVSMSLGGLGASPLLDEAARALSAANIPCIVAAGNESYDAKYSSPANAPGVITVSALAQESSDYDYYPYSLAEYSNYGESIDFSAPGSWINSASLYGTESRTRMSGTSMAAPFVAGCTADILALRPELTCPEVYDYLKYNALDLGEEGHDSSFGWGMVQLGTFTFTDGTVAAPEASIPGGDYDGALYVSLKTATEDASIYYTLDGSVPDTGNGILYTGGSVTITQSCVLNAIAVKGDSISKRCREEYNLSLAAPRISPDPGMYKSAISVTLNAVAGAEIYYTLDGTFPTPETGLRYTDTPIKVEKTAVVQAVAVFNGKESACACAGYAIGDKDYQNLFVVEDGVLVRSGAFTPDIDLNELFPGNELTAIGDKAFYGCERLCSVVLPESVRTIGAEAFAACERLESIQAPGVTVLGDGAFRNDSNFAGASSDLHSVTVIGREALSGISYSVRKCLTPEIITEIGESAFENSTFDSDVSFDSLQKLGAYAFAGAVIDAPHLPDTITELPDGVFSGAHMLWTLYADKLTKIGDYALAGCDMLDLSGVDCSGIRSVGQCAFAAMEFEEPVEFPALEDIGKEAFRGVYGISFSLPALKEVRKGALNKIGSGIFFLPNVETLRSSSIELISISSGIVVGDKLETIEPDAFVYAISAAPCCAGPADSPLKQYALRNRIDYTDTPDIFKMRLDTTIPQFDDSPMNVMYLGFGVKADWYHAESKDGEGTLFAENTTGCRPDTTVPGTSYYYAKLTDENGHQKTTEHLEITVTAAQEGDTMQTGLNIFQWEKYTAEGRITMSFTAPESRTYGFYFCQGDLNVTLLRSSGERIALKTWAYNETELEKGETVQVFADRNGYSQNYQAIWILTEDLVHEEIGHDVEIPSVPILFTGEEPHDAVKVYQYQDGYAADGSMTEIEPFLLEEGKDYTVCFNNADVPGGTEYFVFTSGENGIRPDMLYGSLGTAQEIELNKPANIGRLTPETDRCYQFRPEESGVYMFYVSPQAGVTEDFAAVTQLFTDMYSGSFEALWLTQVNHDHEQQLDYVENAATRCYCRAYLEAGNTYNIYIGFADGWGEESFYDLLAMNVVKDTDFLPDFVDDSNLGALTYTGEAQYPTPLIQTPAGTPLKEGKSYRIHYLNAALPGYIYTVAEGIGDCVGTYLGCTPCNIPKGMLEPQKIGEHQTVTVTEPFGLYELPSNGMTYEMSVRPENGCEWPAEVTIFYTCNTYPDWEMMAVIPNADSFSTIYGDDSKYMMMIVPKAGETFSFSVAYNVLGSFSSALEAKPLTEPWTGEPVIPHPYVYDINTKKQLTEGTDYTVAADEMTACGVYTYKIIGINRYYGSDTAAKLCIIPTAETPATELLPETQLEPGTLYCFTAAPEIERYVFWKDELFYSNVRIYDPYFRQVALLTEQDHQAIAFTPETGRRYYITTDHSVLLHTIANGKLLSECRLEMADHILNTGSGEIPAYAFYDGDTLLTEGHDYYVRIKGNYDWDNRSVITFCGMGNYAGTLEKGYLVYTGIAEFAAGQDDIVLTVSENLEEGYSCMRDLPGTVRTFSFTAPADGEYYFGIMEDDANAINTYFFDAADNLIELPDHKLTMQKDQKIRFACVTDWLEGADPSAYITIAVMERVPEHWFYTDDLYVWFVQDGKAYLENILADYGNDPTQRAVLHLPETVYCERFGTELEVGGLSEFARELFAGCILYLRPGEEIPQYKGSVYWAYTEPDTLLAGDISGDGIVDMTDIVILTAWLNETAGIEMNDIAFANADCNGDGILTLADLTALSRLC